MLTNDQPLTVATTQDKPTQQTVKYGCFSIWGDWNDL